MEQLVLGGRILPGNTVWHRADRWLPPWMLLLLLLHQRRWLPELLWLLHRWSPERGPETPAAARGRFMGTGAPAGVANEGARERPAGARRAPWPADECAGGWLPGARRAAGPADECARDGLARARRATRATDECAGGGPARAGGGSPRACGGMNDEGRVRVVIGSAGAWAPQIQERRSSGGRDAALEGRRGREGSIVRVGGVGVLVVVERGAAKVLGEPLKKRRQRGGVFLLVFLRPRGGAPAAAGVVFIVIAVDNKGWVDVGFLGTRPRRARGESHGVPREVGGDGEGARREWQMGKIVCLVGSSSLESGKYGSGLDGPSHFRPTRPHPITHRPESFEDWRVSHFPPLSCTCRLHTRSFWKKKTMQRCGRTFRASYQWEDVGCGRTGRCWMW